MIYSISTLIEMQRFLIPIGYNIKKSTLMNLVETKLFLIFLLDKILFYNFFFNFGLIFNKFKIL